VLGLVQLSLVRCAEMVAKLRSLAQIVAAVHEIAVTEIIGDASVMVNDITHDSHKSGSGAIFCCVVGETTDGHNFVNDAINNGASAVLTQRRLAIDIPQVVVTDVRHAMGYFAAELFGRPSSKIKIVGVTGTNGKTTTAHLLAAILRQHGWDTAVFGTLSGTRTTPESTDLQRALSQEVDRGTKAVVMEVSSHALVLCRVVGTKFAATVFTNLGQDHLDFHHTIENYFVAKSQLFTEQYSEIAIVNRDDVYGRKLISALKSKNEISVQEFGITDASEIEADVSRVSFAWRGGKIHLATGGHFNLMNALAAANAAVKLGVATSDISTGLAAADAIAGRFESVVAGQKFGVVVDYAHTPEALENVLHAARKVVSKSSQVIVVFGCGGGRDHNKRAIMGRVASELADVVVITTDNPRFEDAAEIAGEIESGIDSSRQKKIYVILDRRSAIAQAFASAISGDIVVIAGKGHESTQTIGATEIEFNDSVVSRELLKVAS